MMKHYRSAAGAYLGAFGPGVPAPAGGIEVAAPPAWSGDTWDAQAGAWTGTPAPAATDPVLDALQALSDAAPAATKATVQPLIDAAKAARGLA